MYALEDDPEPGQRTASVPADGEGRAITENSRKLLQAASAPADSKSRTLTEASHKLLRTELKWKYRKIVKEATASGENEQADAAKKTAEALNQTRSKMDPRTKRDIEAGHSVRMAKKKEKSRLRALAHRRATAPARAQERVKAERAWHEDHDKPDTGEHYVNPFAPAGPQVAAPLSKDEKKSHRLETQQDEDEVMEKPIIRNWEKPRWMRRNTEEAKAKHKKKSKARKKEKEATPPWRRAASAHVRVECVDAGHGPEEPKEEGESALPPWHRAASAHAEESHAEDRPWHRAASAHAEEGHADGEPKVLKLCWRYSKGQCKFGDACPYMHGFYAQSKKRARPPQGGGLIASMEGKGSAPRTQKPRLDLTVDSGSAVHALPRDAASQYPTEKGEQREFRAASGHSVSALGKRTPKFTFQNRTSGNIEFTVMDVSKPLLSVAKIVSKGYRVVFDDGGDGSYILNKKTGEWKRIYERHGVYVLPAWLEEPTFGGQAQP